MKRKNRTFELGKEKAGIFKEYCRDMHIDAIIERYNGKAWFNCIMTDDEYEKAKQFIEQYCQPDQEERKVKVIVTHIIIVETM